MDASTARIRLEAMTAWESEPTLDTDELDALVEMARRADSDGFAPSDEDWTPTYDLASAAAEGWRWKAAKAASKFDVSTDGQSVSRSQVKRHCDEMAMTYQRKVVQQVPVYGTLTTPYTREAV
jgi:hypothetical protein